MGGRATGYNGQTVEELMELNEFLCLNNGQGTRLNSISNRLESAIDLTLVSAN